MFLTNKYTKWYFNIIYQRKANDLENIYKENHHIIPSSLGGSDDSDNRVYLTAREHFVCHALLCKMFKQDTFEWYKMHHAFLYMKCSSSNQSRYFNSKLYSYYKTNFSKTMSIFQSGINNSQYGKIWISNIELKVSKTIKLEELSSYLDKGFIPKRIIDFDKYQNRIDKEIEIKQEKYDIKYLEAKSIYEHFISTKLSLRKYCKEHYNKSHVALYEKFKRYNLL